MIEILRLKHDDLTHFGHVLNGNGHVKTFWYFLEAEFWLFFGIESHLIGDVVSFWTEPVRRLCLSACIYSFIIYSN